MKGAPSIGGSAQAVSNANTVQDLAATTSSASQARATRLNERKLKAEIDLLRSQANNQNSQARNTANLGNITQNLGNLSTGFHGLTSNAAKSADASIKQLVRDKDKIISKLKKAPSDYWWAAKRGANKLKFWKRK